MIWEILLGILYICAGVYVLWNPVLGLVSLTIGLAAYLLLEAILEFVLAVRLRPAPGSGWLFFDGIITLILAVVIWRTWPLSAVLGHRNLGWNQHAFQWHGTAHAFTGSAKARCQAGHCQLASF